MQVMNNVKPVHNYLRMPRIHELRLENISPRIQDGLKIEQICKNCRCSTSPLFIIKINGTINTTEYLCESCSIELLANEIVNQVLKSVCCGYTECQIIHPVKPHENYQFLEVTNENSKNSINNNGDLLVNICPRSSSSGYYEEEIEPKICKYNFADSIDGVMDDLNYEQVELLINDCNDNVESQLKIQIVEPSLLSLKSVKFSDTEPNIDTPDGVITKEIDTKPNKDAPDDVINKEMDIKFHYGVPLSEFYTDELKIGSGKFGKVSRVTHKKTKKYFAAKTIIYRNQKTRDSIINEIQILSCLYGNEHIMQLIEVIDNNTSRPKSLYLITEYLEGGELFDQIANDELLTEEQVIGIMCQILDGVAFIHDRGIIHRDLKPENIVYSSKTNDILKIIDFGFAVKFDDKKPPKSMVGTTIFVAPEVLRFECQSYFTDMWSVGVITYNLLAGITPFEIPLTGDPMRNLSDQEIIENIEKGQYDFDDEGFIGVSDEAKNFISSLLIREPNKRLSAKDCLKHNWLSSSVNPNKETNLSRSISLQRMKNYVAVQKWQKIGLAIKIMNNFKNGVLS